MSDSYKFYEINDFIKTLNFNIQSKSPDFFVYRYQDVDWNRINQLCSYQHDYFEITLDKTKGCDFLVDQFALPHVEGRLTLISPDRLQTIKAYGGKQRILEGYGIFFRPEFIETHSFNKNFLKDFPFFHHRNSPALQLEKDDLASFVDIIQNIKNEHDHNNHSNIQIIRHYLHILFLKARQNYGPNLDRSKILSREQEIYDEFKWLVHLHWRELKSVQSYADKMHMTSKHLSETIKKISGESALELIHKKKLNYAKSLLSHTNKTVSEIAYELNFENPEYFSVFFKRLSGRSPSFYRCTLT